MQGERSTGSSLWSYRYWLLLFAVVAFVPALRGDWVYDDVRLIAEHPDVGHFDVEHLTHLLVRPMWEGMGTNSYVYLRPVVMVSYAFDWWLGGGKTLPFHITNILVHLAVTWLLLRALVRWTGDRGLSVVGAAWFSLHPARAESVAWISGRPDPFVALGLLLCAEAYALFGRARKVQGSLLLAAGVVFAFGSKEIAVILPLFAVAECVSKEVIGNRLRLFWWLGGFSVLVSLLYLGFRSFAFPLRTAGETPSLWLHSLCILETLGRNVTTWVLPFDLSLLASSIRVTARGIQTSGVYVGLGALAVLLAAFGFVYTKFRARLALAGVLIALAPTANLIWTGAFTLTSPRYLYVPSLLASWFLVEVLRGVSFSVTERGKTLLFFSSLALGSVAMANRSLDFVDENAFWTAEGEHNPTNLSVLRHLVQDDFTQRKLERGVARAECAFSLDTENHRNVAYKAKVLSDVLTRLADTIPDADEKRLRRFARFLEDIDDSGRDAKLVEPITVEVTKGSALKRGFRENEGRFSILLTEILLRSGDDDGARKLLRRAEKESLTTFPARRRLALLAFRLGDTEVMARVLPEPCPQFLGALSKNEALEVVRDLRARAAGNDDVAHVASLQLYLELGLPGQALKKAREFWGDDLGQLPAGEAQELVKSAAVFADDTRLRKALGVDPSLVSGRPVYSAKLAKELGATLSKECRFPDEAQ